MGGTSRVRSSLAIRNWQVNEADGIVAALSPVVQAFRFLGIRHYIAGSVASSFHGATRSTMDDDVVAELNDESVSRFLQQLGSDY